MITLDKETSQDEIDSRDYIAIGDRFEACPDDYLVTKVRLFNHEHDIHLIRIRDVEMVKHPYLPGEQLIRPLAPSDSLQFILDQMLDLLNIRCPARAVLVRGMEYLLFVSPVNANVNRNN